ncbi:MULTISPECIES: LamG-like jellyroll fold domain-containing protein [unclassified Carboxylicivirga]|uniref:LamG-like jellyroll fold domain-containing protein n=1 Tax=Carboxylicivirga TaxID=1628153 RepID=UPI003D33B0AB
MKKLMIVCFALLSYVGVMQAQVDNYALSMPTGSGVTLNELTALSNSDSYTLQFWMNPGVWSPGATILSTGTQALRTELGTENKLLFKVGERTLTISSPALMAGKWCHLSLVYAKGQASVYVNGIVQTTETINLDLPVSLGSLSLGGNNYEGRLDELRFWNTAISDPFFLMWRNTVNKHHPNYANLVAYYKFDQDQCPNVVDYQMKHHGTFTGSADRSLVADNQAFKYRRSVAYTDFARWADREIDADKYLLSNDLIILSLEVNSAGEVNIPFADNKGSVSNGNYLSEYQGRQGVLALNGLGAQMNVGAKAFNPKDKYAFSSWIYLEEWTEGAFIFQKEKSDTEGFSIRLGDEARKTIVVRINGVDYLRPNNMEVKKWVHLGVAAYSTNNYNVFHASFNGETYPAINMEVSVHDYQVSGLESTPALIGVNLNAKLDETVLWNAYRSSDNMKAAMTETPMPSDTRKVEAQTLFVMDSYWDYNRPENVGYDSYSYKHFISIMRSHYEGHRGYMIRGGFKGFSGWEDRFADPAFRSKFADEVARIAPEFDGIDLDFEWCYDGTCWDNYGKVIEAIRAKFPADKVLTVTPHYVAYTLPQQYVDKVDYFPFQIYGPGKHVFLYSTYVDALNRFTAGGRYPKEKIVLSYATTTSRGYDAVTDVENKGVAPTGVRNGLLDNGYTPDMNSVIDGSGYRRYITGYNQVIDRCEFIHDNDLGGIMYWDMGNDVKTSHPYSLAKAASFSLNSNVDPLITSVDTTPTGMEDIENTAGQMRVFPNPVKSVLNIEMPAGERLRSGKVFNTRGAVVREIAEAQVQVPVQALNTGLYFIQIESDTNTSYTSKFIIQ